MLQEMFTFLIYPENRESYIYVEKFLSQSLLLGIESLRLHDFATRIGVPTIYFVNSPGILTDMLSTCMRPPQLTYRFSRARALTRCP
jgi:hypothetical protein